MKLAMNSLCAAAFILLVGKASAIDKDYDQIRDKCLELHNITLDEVAAIKPNDSKDVTAVEHKFKCFSHCMMDKMRYLDDKGKVDTNKLKAYGSVTEFQLDALDACKAKHDVIDDPCEYIFQIAICVMESMEKDENHVEPSD